MGQYEKVMSSTPTHHQVTEIKNGGATSGTSNNKNAQQFQEAVATPALSTKTIGQLAESFITGITGSSAAMASDNSSNGILGTDTDGIPRFDETHPDFHTYYTERSCSKQNSWCTSDNAYQGLLRYPAPGASGDPIQDEQTSFALPVGNVRHEVYPERKMVYNVTLPSEHVLHPGIVQRWIDESANQVTIKTYGEGTGNFGSLNEILSNPLWSSVDDNIFTYMKNQ